MNKTITKELVLLKDLGMKFPTLESKRKHRYGLYQCFCGEEFETIIVGVNNGHTKSCGCLKVSHRLSTHRLYGTWTGMIHRCTNSNHKFYKNYGGRGIKVCDEWNEVQNFIEDMYPSFQEGLTLDRIDVNGHYCKDNCRWASISVQISNTRLLRITNTSGYRGVFLLRGKYQTSISINNKSIHLGTFSTAIEAAKARDKYIIDNNLPHTLNFKREE